MSVPLILYRKEIANILQKVRMWLANLKTYLLIYIQYIIQDLDKSANYAVFMTKTFVMNSHESLVLPNYVKDIYYLKPINSIVKLFFVYLN